MTNQATATTAFFALPCRLQWLRGTTVLAGTPGAEGDAGWTMLCCPDLAHAQRLMREWPQARMRCWGQIEKLSV